jgi:hypothetical protein
LPTVLYFRTVMVLITPSSSYVIVCGPDGEADGLNEAGAEMVAEDLLVRVPAGEFADFEVGVGRAGLAHKT